MRLLARYIKKGSPGGFLFDRQAETETVKTFYKSDLNSSLNAILISSNATKISYDPAE